MNHKKTIISLALLLTMVLCFNNTTNVSAKSNNTNKQGEEKSLEQDFDNHGFTYEPNENEQNVTITDPDELDEIIEDDNLDVPDGYTLTKVEINSYTADTNDSQNSINNFDLMSMNNSTDFNNTQTLLSNIQTLSSTSYSIKSVVDKDDGWYFSSDYDSDWYYGPCTVSESYSQTRSSKATATVSVKNSLVEAAVGIEIGEEKTNTKTFSTTVASNKKLKVKVYTNYHKWTFSIYKGSTKKGTGAAYEPVGLIFKQYTYTAS